MQLQLEGTNLVGLRGIFIKTGRSFQKELRGINVELIFLILYEEINFK